VQVNDVTDELFAFSDEITIGLEPQPKFSLAKSIFAP
jgi:hypothetical protein